MIVNVGKQEYYMDGWLNSNLNLAQDLLKKDFDIVFIIDGMERSGKSVFAMQLAYYLDPTLTLDRVCFTAEEFKRAVRKAKHGQAVILDEAMTALFSRASMSKTNINVVRLLAECGQKNLIIVIVLPSFFVLDMYAAVHRSRCLLHTYTMKRKGKIMRGFFRFYNMQRKKMLYLTGKKFYNYAGAKSNFMGRFVNHYVLDEKEYRAKKGKSLTDSSLEDVVDWKYEVAKALKSIDMSSKDIAVWFLANKKIKVAARTVREWCGK